MLKKIRFDGLFKSFDFYCEWKSYSDTILNLNELINK